MDLLWTDDMQLDAAETTTDEEELEQDVIHVLEQDVGTNPDDPTRGLGIANISSQGLVESTKSWEQRAVTEIQKDDRVDSTTAKLDVAADGSVQLNCTIDVDDSVLDITVAVPTTGAETT